jgi:hypothetical protein
MPKIDIAAVPDAKVLAIRRHSTLPVPNACGSG